MLHCTLGQQRIEVIGIGIQIACVLHVHSNLCAGVTMPAVNALNNADTSHDIRIVKGFEVGLKHSRNSQVPHLDLFVDEVGEHLVPSL